MSKIMNVYARKFATFLLDYYFIQLSPGSGNLTVTVTNLCKAVEMVVVFLRGGMTICFGLLLEICATATRKTHLCHPCSIYVIWVNYKNMNAVLCFADVEF